MFENFREKLHIVQQDFTTGLVRCFLRPNSSYCLWSAHGHPSLFQALDGDIVMLSAHWERKMTSLTQLHEQLQSLPAFISDLDAITANIAHLEGDFEEMESRLVYLEALCLQCEQQTAKQQHINQSENYKKKKSLIKLITFKELGSEHAQKVAELELVMQQKLRERQKVYEEAFNQDVEKYLSTGCLQNRARRGTGQSGER
uniref:Dystrobrevin binding protein 1a n=1 Tax=Haplochromis burtoni TaxID=8153 RepID=A0A3Q2WJI6_HAPBU